MAEQIKNANKIRNIFCMTKTLRHSEQIEAELSFSTKTHNQSIKNKADSYQNLFYFHLNFFLETIYAVNTLVHFPRLFIRVPSGHGNWFCFGPQPNRHASFGFLWSFEVSSGFSDSYCLQSRMSANDNSIIIKAMNKTKVIFMMKLYLHAWFCRLAETSKHSW